VRFPTSGRFFRTAVTEITTGETDLLFGVETIRFLDGDWLLA